MRQVLTLRHSSRVLGSGNWRWVVVVGGGWWLVVGGLVVGGSPDQTNYRLFRPVSVACAGARAWMCLPCLGFRSPIPLGRRAEEQWHSGTMAQRGRHHLYPWQPAMGSTTAFAWLQGRWLPSLDSRPPLLGIAKGIARAVSLPGPALTIPLSPLPPLGPTSVETAAVSHSWRRELVGVRLIARSEMRHKICTAPECLTGGRTRAAYMYEEARGTKGLCWI